MPVTVKITDGRFIVRQSELPCIERSVMAVLAVPCCGRGPEHRDIRCAVSIIVGRCRQVLGDAENTIVDGSVRALEYIPDAIRRPVHSDVILAVAVIVTRRYLIRSE